jgi:hypothetical protein
MALKVSTTPGFVFVTCGSETVVVAGVLVSPPGGSKTAFPTPAGRETSTTWIPAVQEPEPPPPTGHGRGCISTEVVDAISEQFVSLALSGAHVDLVTPESAPLEKLLASKEFFDFNRSMCGPYALTVSPKARMTVTANKASVVVGELAPSVLIKNWIPNG